MRKSKNERDSAANEIDCSPLSSSIPERISRDKIRSVNFDRIPYKNKI